MQQQISPRSGHEVYLSCLGSRYGIFTKDTRYTEYTIKKETPNSSSDALPDPMSDPLPNTERVMIDEAGRLVVPARFRRALDIQGRQQLIMGLEGDTIRLRTPSAALARLQAIVRRHRKGSGSVVDEFILERRAEAARE